MAYDPATGLYITNQADGNQYAEAMLELANYNNNWSAEQVQKQMDFQREMSDTAHQREMRDLQAAGLNPILSAKSGATSPSGAAAQPDTNITSALSSLFSTMLDIQSDNAKANLLNAARGSGQGSGATGAYYGSSASSSYYNRDVTVLTLEALGFRPSDAEKIAMTGERIMQSDLGQAVTQAINKVTGSVSNAAKTVGNVVSNAVSQIKENATVSNFVAGTQKIANSVATGVSNAISSAKAAISNSSVGKAVQSAAKSVASAVNKLKSFF